MFGECDVFLFWKKRRLDGYDLTNRAKVSSYGVRLTRPHGTPVEYERFEASKTERSMVTR